MTTVEIEIKDDMNISLFYLQDYLLKLFCLFIHIQDLKHVSFRLILPKGNTYLINVKTMTIYWI